MENTFFLGTATSKNVFNNKIHHDLEDWNFFFIITFIANDEH